MIPMTPRGGTRQGALCRRRIRHCESESQLPRTMQPALPRALPPQASLDRLPRPSRLPEVEMDIDRPRDSLEVNALVLRPITNPPCVSSMDQDAGANCGRSI